MRHTPNNDTTGSNNMSKRRRGAVVASSRVDPSTGLSKIDRIAVDSLDPKELWERYIADRRPVVLHGLPSDLQHLTELWSDGYLAHTAGECTVKVEHRMGHYDSYGQGKKKSMSFKEFLESYRNEELYLTTQKSAHGPDGQPDLIAPPITSLSKDLPLVPTLAGFLVPQSINIWMGSTQLGTSSGLHHDFHDNFYVLLRGRKMFLLHPPLEACSMYTHGKLQKTYPNGRIVYKSQGKHVQSDGSHALDVKQWRAQRCAEQAIAEAEEAVQQGQDGGEARLQRAEEILDDVLENALMREDFEEDMSDQEEETAPPPPSFSKVNTSLPRDRIRKLFPKYPGKEAGITLEVRAGEMLYLPCGWFHEVTSYNDDDGGGGLEKASSHLALNYWFHPPDNLSPNHFHTPYTSEYWPEFWRERKQRLLKSLTWRKGVDEEEFERLPAVQKHFFGMFGYGRRQHLYRFITLHS